MLMLSHLTPCLGTGCHHSLLLLLVLLLSCLARVLHVPAAPTWVRVLVLRPAQPHLRSHPWNYAQIRGEPQSRALSNNCQQQGDGLKNYLTLAMGIALVQQATVEKLCIWEQAIGCAADL